MNETSATPPPGRRSCVIKAIFILVALAIIIGVAWWWFTRPIEPVVLTPQEKEVVEEKVEAIQEPTYTPGVREIVLTERELNGLLNEHTTLGRSVKFELGTDAIHARVETDLDQDFPVLGGKRLKGKARMLVKETPEGLQVVVEDVTLWGVSLPNDWLGGLKGRNLIEELLGGGQGGTLAGVESMKLLPGELRIELKE